jgi:hypothetical protein
MLVLEIEIMDNQYCSRIKNQGFMQQKYTWDRGYEKEEAYNSRVVSVSWFTGVLQPLSLSAS